MPTSSVFADFTIRDKKAAKRFAKVIDKPIKINKNAIESRTATEDDIHKLVKHLSNDNNS